MKFSNIGWEALVIAYHQHTQEYYVYPFKILDDGTVKGKKQN